MTIPGIATENVRGSFAGTKLAAPSMARCYRTVWRLHGAKKPFDRFLADRGLREASPESLKPDIRFVYFIGADDGPVKIGISRTPVGRLESLQTGSPVRLSILATVPGTLDDERAYHQRFASSRIAGEWFSRTPSLQAEIDRLQEVGA